mmetsp:Transcript_121875/g.227721  ORF Transcript_121875/g.227721 Transcript_121875/m.227721 type:complete len:202 (-) Transcript_121875:118-723(-)
MVDKTRLLLLQLFLIIPIGVRSIGHNNDQIDKLYSQESARITFIQSCTAGYCSHRHFAMHSFDEATLHCDWYMQLFQNLSIQASFGKVELPRHRTENYILGADEHKVREKVPKQHLSLPSHDLVCRPFDLRAPCPHLHGDSATTKHASNGPDDTSCTHRQFTTCDSNHETSKDHKALDHVSFPLPEVPALNKHPHKDLDAE